MTLRELTSNERERMIDLRGPEIVGVQIDRDPSGKLTIWVCVDGRCRLRITKVPIIELTVHGECKVVE